MDVLSDLLRVVRLDGAYFYPVEAGEPWCVVSARASELAPRILPGAEHLISYHILTRGYCYAGLAGEEQVELLAGDVILFPHGDPTVMSSARELAIGAGTNTQSPARYPETVLVGAQGSRRTSFGEST